MRTKVLAAAALVLAAVVLAGGATAASAGKQQRIVIAFQPKSGTFALVPLTSGPILRDSGTYSACCWDAPASSRVTPSRWEIDNPTVAFTGKRGRFTGYERITYVDSDNDYTVATAVWTIAHGYRRLRTPRGTRPRSGSKPNGGESPRRRGPPRPRRR